MLSRRKRQTNDRRLYVHAQSGGRDVHVLHQHQAPRILQPELLLELQRRHPRHGATLRLQALRTHADVRRKPLDAEPFLEDLAMLD